MARVLDSFGEVGRISDAELVGRLERLVNADRVLSAKLLVHLGEVDARGLYRDHGFSSMFEFCRTALRMSEAEAFLRILAARLGRRFPLVVERLGAGALNLTAIKLLAPHLTADNHAQLLERARGKTKREIEALVAELAPQPDVPARIRKLPDARGSTGESSIAAAIAPRASLSASHPLCGDRVGAAFSGARACITALTSSAVVPAGALPPSASMPSSDSGVEACAASARAKLAPSLGATAGQPIALQGPRPTREPKRGPALGAAA